MSNLIEMKFTFVQRQKLIAPGGNEMNIVNWNFIRLTD